MRKIKFHKASINKEEFQNVNKVLKSGWLTTGYQVKKFEKNFLKIFKRKLYCSAINSCTSGIFLTLKALGVGKNDEVITSDLTFTSTVSSIYHANAKPVIADIDYDTLNISVESIKKKISKKTKCIIVVHYGGRPANLKQISMLAKENGIKLIEDAAHCLPSYYEKKLIGENYSDATIFSFYVTKTLTTSEGGMVLSKNKKIIDYIKLNSFHGIDRDVYSRYNNPSYSWYYNVISPGYKYNLTDISASLGIAQLKKLRSNYLKRKKIANLYFKLLKSKKILLPLKDTTDIKNSWHLFVIKILKNNRFNRNELSQMLSKIGIGTSVHYVPIHKHKFWKKNLKLDKKYYINTEKAFNEILSLPIYPDLNMKEIKYITNKINKLLY